MREFISDSGCGKVRAARSGLGFSQSRGVVFPSNPAAKWLLTVANIGRQNRGSASEEAHLSVRSASSRTFGIVRSHLDLLQERSFESSKVGEHQHCRENGDGLFLTQTCIKEVH